MGPCLHCGSYSTPQKKIEWHTSSISLTLLLHGVTVLRYLLAHVHLVFAHIFLSRRVATWLDLPGLGERIVLSSSYYTSDTITA